MSCDNCFNSCKIAQCATTVYIGKVDEVSSTFDIFVTNVGSGRVQIYAGTSDGDGVLSFTPDEFLRSGAEFKINAVEDGAGMPTEIYPYTDSDTPTFDTDTFNCGWFKTYAVYSDEDMYVLSDQYLVKA